MTFTKRDTATGQFVAPVHFVYTRWDMQTACGVHRVTANLAGKKHLTGVLARVTCSACLRVTGA